MQRKFFGLLALASLCATGALQAGAIENLFSSFWKTQKPEVHSIGVLVVHDAPGVVLEVKGKYKLYDPNTNSFVSTRFIGKRKFVQALADGLKWGEEFPGVHQIKIVPDDEKTTTLVDGVEYKGNVFVYDIGGTISIVNEVSLDDYLNALLAESNNQKLPDELAAALVIAARTGAFFQSENSSSKYWSVEAGKVGYQGNAATVSNPHIAQAVKSTKNMILTKNGASFPADWSEKPSANAYPVKSQISLDQAANLANSGSNAAQILSEAFPGSTITLIEALQ